MKNLVFAASFAACLVSVLVFGFLHVRQTVDVGPKDERSIHSKVAVLEELVARLEERLEVVLAEIEARPPLPSSTAGFANDSEPSTEPVASSVDSVKTLDLASAPLNEGGDRLRELVFDLVEQAHAERLEAERLEMARRVEAHEELRSGPYGRYNYQVNSVAEKLELTEQQTMWYHELLASYGERLDSVLVGVEKDNAESRIAYRRSRQILQAEFEATLAQALSDGQLDDLESLPPWLGRITPSGSEPSRTKLP